MIDLSWWQVVFLILMGYAVNAFVLHVYGDESLETSRWLFVLRLSSVIPFGSPVVVAIAVLSSLLCLVVLAVPFCIVSGITALWRAWSRLIHKEEEK
jgi:hypothetical protein